MSPEEKDRNEKLLEEFLFVIETFGDSYNKTHNKETFHFYNKTTRDAWNLFRMGAISGILYERERSEKEKK